jgi:hypothetical protein
MYCDGLMDAEAALMTILEGEDLRIVSDGITSSAGLIRIDGGVHFAMADGVAPGDVITVNEPSDPTGLTLAVLLLFAPIASAVFALSRGLTTKS